MLFGEIAKIKKSDGTHSCLDTPRQPYVIRGNISHNKANNDPNRSARKLRKTMQQKSCPRKARAGTKSPLYADSQTIMSAQSNPRCHTPPHLSKIVTRPPCLHAEPCPSKLHQPKQPNHLVRAQQLFGLLSPAKRTFRVHKITGQDKEKRHMERKTDLINNLRRNLRDKVISFKSAMSNNHSEYSDALGNIKIFNSIHVFYR